MSVKKGNYYKYKLKKRLVDEGYCVEYLEKVQRIPDGKGGILNIKRDLFASDMLAMKIDELVFIQLKSGKTGKKNIASAFKEFEKYPFPPFVKKWVVLYEPNKDFDIIEV
jgi:hypothetical protein